MSTWIGIIALVAIAVLVLPRVLGVGKVSGEDARRLVEKGAALVDVRTPGEFAGGHIDGAINIPVDALDDRLKELPDKNAAIVVYCRSGARSGRAARLLSSSGYTNVHDLGPMTRW